MRLRMTKRRHPSPRPLRAVSFQGVVARIHFTTNEGATVVRSPLCRSSFFSTVPTVHGHPS